MDQQLEFALPVKAIAIHVPLHRTPVAVVLVLKAETTSMDLLASINAQTDSIKMRCHTDVKDVLLAAINVMRMIKGFAKNVSLD